jgi:hypothetical protein
VFDSFSADRVKFIPFTPDQKKELRSRSAALPFFTAVVTLKRAPIPASVRITRYYLSIPPSEIKVAGRQVSFGTPSDKLDFTTGGPDGAPIYVQYHPAR